MVTIQKDGLILPFPKWLKWAAIAMATLTFVSILLYALLASGLSNAALKSRLEASLSSWSGLIVRSDETIDLGLFPPKVTLSAVRAESAVRGIVLEAKQVTVFYSIFSLLAQEPVMREVDVSGATVVIDTGRTVRLNDFFHTSPLGPALQSAKSATPNENISADIRRVMAAPGVLRFTDAKVELLRGDGAREHVEDLTGAVRWADLDGSASLSLSLRFRGEQARLEAQGIEPLKLLTGFETMITVQFKSAPVRFDYSGKLALNNGIFSEGSFKASLPSLRQALAWMNAPSVLPINQDGLVLDARLSLMEGKIALNDLSLEFAGSTADGMIVVDPALTRPLVSGSLAFETADLGSMVAALEPAQQTAFSGLDLDLRMSSETLNASTIKLSNAAGTVKVTGSETLLDLGSSEFAGGECIGSLKFSGPYGKRLGTLKLSIKDILADQMEVYDASFPLLAARLSAQFEASGEFYNWTQFVRQANGLLKLDIGEGIARNFSTDKLAGLVSEGAVFALSDAYAGLTPLVGGSVSGTFSGGAAIINSAVLQFASHYIRLSGAVPLLTGGVALSGRIIPAGDDPSGRLFFIGGAWSRPFVTMGSTGQ